MVGKLVLLIGPSGVGKSVILKKLRSMHPEWHFPRSATTRSQRHGEGDTLYRFVSDTAFDQLITDHQMLEWAVVHGGPPGQNDSVRTAARYGTLVEEIIPFINKEIIVVREVDVQGFDSIRSHPLFHGDDAPHQLQSLFILPENKNQLIERIKNRSPISRDELIRRIASMEKELSYAEKCDDQVMNTEGRLSETVTAIEKCIMDS
jgi:guanylate kinase